MRVNCQAILVYNRSMNKRVMVLIIIAAVLIQIGVATADSPNAQLQTMTLDRPALPTYDGCGQDNAPVQEATMEERAVELINAARKDAGMRPLKMVAPLREAARYHAADMVQDDYRETATYDIVDGVLTEICDTNTRLRTFYFELGSWTMGTSYTAETAEEAVSGWLAGGQMTDWLLSANWDEIGVGYYANSEQTRKYWVVHQGTSSNTPLVINYEAIEAFSTSVDLYVYGNFDTMRLRNNGGEWSDWIPFQNEIAWSMDNFVGQQTVEAEMWGFNTVVFSSDSITVLNTSSETPTPSPTPEPTVTPTPLPTPPPLTCNPSNGSGGLTAGYYETTLFDHNAVIIVGENYDPAAPAMLAFYLHGDGGNYEYYSTPGQPLNTFINDRGWIYVSVQSNVATEGTTRWWGDGVGNDDINVMIESNAQLLRDVYEAMFDQYNLCQNVLFGYSASGGSWFYDGYFYPTSGAQYPAFMNLACGSSGLNTDWTPFSFYDSLVTTSQNSDALQRTHLHYTIGTDDFLYPRAIETAPHYQSLGYTVSTDYLANVTHCDFDIPFQAITFWAEKADALQLTDVGTAPLAVTMQPGQSAGQMHYWWLTVLSVLVTAAMMAKSRQAHHADADEDG